MLRQLLGPSERYFSNIGGSETPINSRKVIKEVGATRTLTKGESGALCLFDRAAGTVFTLPAPEAGLEFEFRVTTSVTTNAHKIITSAATIFLGGTVLSVDTDTSDALAAFTFNGTTHVAYSAAGTTTGGLVRSHIKVVCVGNLLWHIDGVNYGSGTVATPASTS